MYNRRVTYNMSTILFSTSSDDNTASRQYLIYLWWDKCIWKWFKFKYSDIQQTLTREYFRLNDVRLEDEDNKMCVCMEKAA